MNTFVSIRNCFLSKYYYSSPHHQNFLFYQAFKTCCDRSLPTPLWKVNGFIWIWISNMSFMNPKIYSTGSKCGQYGGHPRILIPCFAAIFLVEFVIWMDALSNTMIVLFLKVCQFALRMYSEEIRIF